MSNKSPTAVSEVSVFRKAQFRLEYVALRLVIGVFRALPLSLATWASAGAWCRLAPLIAPKRHKRALANLAIAYPEQTQAWRDKIARAHWQNLGRVMVETMWIDRIVADPARIEILSSKVFDRYNNKLGPLIGVSLHQGNYELAIWPLTFGGHATCSRLSKA